MKLKKVVSLIAGVVLCVGIFSGNSQFETIVKAAQVNVNLIQNGNFDTNSKGWGGFTTEGGAGEISYEDGAIKAQVDNCGTMPYSIQIYKDGFRMYKNAKYHLEFDVSSTVNRKVKYTIQLNRGDYRSYTEGIVNSTNEVQKVSQDFVMNEENDMTPRLAFDVGNVAGENLEPHSVKIDNVKLVMLDNTGIEGPEEKPKVEQKILLNQIGYKPDDTKKVVFRTEIKDKKFRVRSKKTKEVVYEGDIKNTTYDIASEEITSTGDFSSVREPGAYAIETDNLGSSYEFTIGEDIYKNAFKDLVRFYYLQRCGQELPEELAGTWAHPACHKDFARIYGTDQKIDVSGGWHDAGDYGHYVAPASQAVADLLLAYSDNKEAFGDDFDIPESGNGIPDILDEVKYEIEWMVKMQDQTSGGVYRKVTCSDFPAYIMPQEEIGERILCPITTEATAEFAATMAMSYEYYKDIEPLFAEKCLAAGEKAWDYLEKTPDMGSFTNPPGVTTGDYYDSDDSGERYWAAAELFKATGKSKYNEAFKAMARKEFKTGYSWMHPGDYGNMAYISAKGADQNVANGIKNAVLNEAQNIVSLAKNDGYNVSNGTNYFWGSTANINNNAMLLAEAYKISPNQEYLEYAKEHINYCFGKNSLGKSFVTGYGSDYPETPHHRPSMAQGKAVPGMIVGGPDKYMDDPTAKIWLVGEGPSRCYCDDSESFSTNEVCINWNAPLIRLMVQLNRN